MIALTKYDYFGGGGQKYGEMKRLPCMEHAKVNEMSSVTMKKRRVLRQIVCFAFVKVHR